MVVKMLTNPGRRMNEHRENFSEEIGSIKKYQTEVIERKNIITGVKIRLEILIADYMKQKKESDLEDRARTHLNRAAIK